MKKQEAKNLSVDDYVQTYMKTYHLNYPINSQEYKKLKDDIKQNYLNDPSIVGKNLNEIINQLHGKVPPPAREGINQNNISYSCRARDR